MDPLDKLRLGNESLLSILREHPPNSEAWAELYRRYTSRLRYYFAHVANVPDFELDRLCQEVFTRFFLTDAPGRIRWPRALTPYILGVARHVAKQYVRDQFRERNLVFTSEVEHYLMTRSNRLFTELTEGEVLEGLYKELEVEEEIDQRIFELRLKGLTIPEIAKSTGESYTNVAVRLHRLTKRLWERWYPR